MISFFCSTQELLLNGDTITPMKPFKQQMGMTNGYSEAAARNAMSHPAFLDQAERQPVKFGSVVQFRVILKTLWMAQQ